jgi:hypothetical protein
MVWTSIKTVNGGMHFAKCSVDEAIFTKLMTISLLFSASFSLRYRNLPPDLKLLQK